MQHIELDFEDEHFARIETMARSVSLDPATFIKMLAAQRVPSGKPRGRPPGRPAEPSQVKQSRALAKQLEVIYKTLRTGAWASDGMEFERHFGAQIAEYMELAREHDVVGLEEFLKREPWREG